MIDCVSIVDELKNNIKKEVSQLHQKPYLAIIQVGNNPASNRYVKGKLKDCEEVGIKAELIKLSENVTDNDIRNKIINLNMNDSVHGIILQLPLPDHLKKYEDKLTNLIDKNKDVDGFRSDSSFIPCTPLGVLTLLDQLNVNLANKRVTLVGYGKLVNRPLCNLLSDRGATVTICRSHTSVEDKNFYCRNSDIIITATGKRNLITKDCLSLYRSIIIIDCGITVENGKQYGDCDEEIYSLNTLTTPRIKGMGLFTRVALLQNTLKAYKERLN